MVERNISVRKTYSMSENSINQDLDFYRSPETINMMQMAAVVGANIEA